MCVESQSLARSLILAGVCLAAGGCYDGDALVERVRNDALRTRLDEVDLGSFRVTLPPNQKSGEMTEINITLFGESQRYKINEINADLTDKSALVQDETLRTLREATREELIDPRLRGIRQRLLATINPLIKDAPLVSVGISDVRFTRH